MKSENLEPLREKILYFVENGMIQSPEYMDALRTYIYDDEDKFQKKYELLAYQAILEYADIFKKRNKNLSESQKNFFVINLISRLTMNINLIQKFSDAFALASYKSGAIKRFRPSRKGWVLVDYEGNKIKFSLMTKAIPFLTKETKQRLKTTERLGHCHFDSIMLSQCLLNDGVKVVTGNISYLEENEKFTHSWIEYTSKSGKELVLDFTMNALIKKEDYYRLRNIDVISSVPKEKIIELFDEKLEALNNIDGKVLLFFFDDLIKIAKKKQSEIQNLQMQ